MPREQPSDPSLLAEDCMNRPVFGTQEVHACRTLDPVEQDGPGLESNLAPVCHLQQIIPETHR